MDAPNGIGRPIEKCFADRLHANGLKPLTGCLSKRGAMKRAQRLWMAIEDFETHDIDYIRDKDNIEDYVVVRCPNLYFPGSSV